MVILVLYVDDVILVFNNRELLDWVKFMFYKRYDMKDIGVFIFVFGVQFLRDRENRIFILYQTKYINEILRRFNLQDVKFVSISGSVGLKFIL